LLKYLYLLGILLSFSIFERFEAAKAEIKKDISTIAKNINVKIFSPYSDASGVIVQRDMNKYLVLTAWHVLKDITQGDELNLKTNDNFIHSYSKGSINKIKNTDLGVFNFESSKNYKLAEIGKVGNSKMGDKIYVFGFPLPNRSIEKSFARLQPGQITANSNSYNKDGYQLLYTNKTLPGMSGGSILNVNGKLIGIHGRSEIDEINSYGNKLISTGTNMGIPISYFENFISKDIKSKENKTSQADDLLAENKSSQADVFLIEAFNLLDTRDNAINMLFLAKKSVEIKPNALGFALIGRAQEILNDSDSALKNYQKAIELNPNIELANKYLAERLPNKDAIKIYEKLTSDYPKNNKYFHESAKRKLDDGNINGSLKDLENGLKIYPQLKNNYCVQEPPNLTNLENYQRRYEECNELRNTHQHLLERAGNTLFVLNKTKKSCMYWKDRYENYFWGATMWEQTGFLAKPDKFFFNNKNYNFERAKEMSQSFSNMNLEKFLYKYCLDYY
tara:strand:+ start:382 stop:1896 length:1515 start_codon:yes stop_codon:yes gene_type:complete